MTFFVSTISCEPTKFSWIYDGDMKELISFGNLDLIFKVTAVKTENPQWGGGGGGGEGDTCFSENTVTSCSSDRKGF